MLEGIPGPISFLGVGISGLRSLLGVGGYAWSQIHSWREDMSGGGAWYVQGVVLPRHVPEVMGIYPLLLTPGGSHHMYGRQVGGTHPNGMHS